MREAPVGVQCVWGSIHFSFCIENHQHIYIAKYQGILSIKVASHWVLSLWGVWKEASAAVLALLSSWRVRCLLHL